MALTSSGTWTKPATVKAIKVTVVGAAGVGTAPGNAGQLYGGGGSGGGYAGGGGAIGGGAGAAGIVVVEEFY